MRSAVAQMKKTNRISISNFFDRENEGKVHMQLEHRKLYDYWP